MAPAVEGGGVGVALAVEGGGVGVAPAVEGGGVGVASASSMSRRHIMQHACWTWCLYATSLHERCEGRNTETQG